MRPDDRDGVPASVRGSLRAGIGRTQPAESMGQRGETDRGVIADAHTHQLVRCGGRAVLQSIQMDGCIEQKLRARNQLLFHERQIRQLASNECNGPFRWLQAPQDAFHIKIQARRRGINPSTLAAAITFSTPGAIAMLFSCSCRTK